MTERVIVAPVEEVEAEIAEERLNHQEWKRRALAAEQRAERAEARWAACEAANEKALSLAERLTVLAVELCDAVEPMLGTMNHYFGPGSRTAVRPESEAAFKRIDAAVKSARAALGGEDG